MPPELHGRPAVLFANHASWLDPLVALYASAMLFPHRPVHAPMDADAMRRYRFFARLGFFGVEQNSRRGAIQFLQGALATLKKPGALLWMTPQGRFADPRERPVRLAPGLSHLAAHANAGETLFVPVATEIVFWEERTPEVLAAFGKPLQADKNLPPRTWNERLGSALESTQNLLAETAIHRDPSAFHDLLRGHAGVGFIYDNLRRFSAACRGREFRAEHGRL